MALRERLDELIRLVMTLPTDVYRGRPANASGAIGEHVRHVLDHVSALIGASPTSGLSYDHRTRGTSVESDVSGHGRSIAAVAEALLRLVRVHMNRLEQSALLLELSASLLAMKATDAATYATAMVVGFDSTGGDLTVTDAGHPPPLWYRAARRQWELLQRPDWSSPGRPVGMPIGLGFGTSYEDFVVTFGADDLLMCYTDGLSDATDDKGLALGVDGLLELARRLPLESPMAAGATLLGLVDAFRHGAPASDDESLIVLRRSAQYGVPEGD
jgi:serine phosphatase RsbU (regulator of sigma subunit)